jgi:putative Mg2+ transporter-C (MgtC) family protein
MESLWPYLGDLHAALPGPLAGAVLVVCSALCGTLVGLERQKRDKPAGMRTMMLICVGSTVFTTASLLVGGGFYADRGRIAAQVVTGIGFLGAGAIIRDRGTVRGLTTGATIWTVAAIGVLIGAGHAAAGLALTVLVIGILVLFRRHESEAETAK